MLVVLLLVGLIKLLLAPLGNQVRRLIPRAGLLGSLAAIALADRLADHGESVLKPLVETWWRAGIAKRLQAGENAIPREQTYALYELMHALRDVGQALAARRA